MTNAAGAFWIMVQNGLREKKAPSKGIAALR
jgi:hypothetical protein